MGFKQAKRDAIQCLEQGNVRNEERNSIDTKNLFATSEVSISEMINILKLARGNQYESTPHHYDSNIMVHIITTTYSVLSWYIKWYFIEPDCIFISVHH